MTADTVPGEIKKLKDAIEESAEWIGGTWLVPFGHIEDCIDEFASRDLALRGDTARRAELADRITNYLCNGGLFNPEAMEHNKVRDLLIDLGTYLRDTSTGDSQ